jgi:hypothetical protein
VSTGLISRGSRTSFVATAPALREPNPDRACDAYRWYPSPRPSRPSESSQPPPTESLPANGRRHSGDDDSQGDWDSRPLYALAECRGAATALEKAMWQTVQLARSAGHSWTEIGDATTWRRCASNCSQTGSTCGEIEDGTPGPSQQMRLSDADGYVLMVAQLEAAEAS